MKTYKHIFFDLDRTLWDFDKNSTEALRELCSLLEIEKRTGITTEDFITVYHRMNEGFWMDYRKGLITKETLRTKRFFKTFAHFGVKDYSLAHRFARAYVNLGPTKPALIAHAADVLEYLSKKYFLHIITNGFSEVQKQKISASGMKNFFRNIITSESAKCRKPDVEIFKIALQKSRASSEISIMIGDDLVADISGARNATIDQVYFNPLKIPHQEKPTYEISCLSELKSVL